MQSLSQFMEYRLFDPKEGFYETQLLSDHFATPSTLHSSYHDYLQKWIFKQNPEAILEIGAGTGALASLMAPNFPKYCILEKSIHQQEIQRQADLLSKSPHVQWSQDLPINFSGLIIVQEVFDCLPANMYMVEGKRILWEWKIQGDTLIQEPIEVSSQALQDYIQARDPFHKGRQSLVDCEPVEFFLKSLYRIMSRESQLLIIDYGSLWPIAQNGECPLRGYCQHKQISHPWAHIGPIDLTYNVDFSLIAWYWESLGGQSLWALPLAQFLIEILQWKEIDPASQDRMLFDPRLMGQSFMAMLLKK